MKHAILSIKFISFHLKWKYFRNELECAIKISDSRMNGRILPAIPDAPCRLTSSVVSVIAFNCEFNLIHFTLQVVTVNRLVHARANCAMRIQRTDFMFRFKTLSNCVCVRVSAPAGRCIDSGENRFRVHRSTGECDQKRQLAYLWFVCSIDYDEKREENTPSMHRIGKLCVMVDVWVCVCAAANRAVSLHEICGHVHRSPSIFAVFFTLNDIWIIFCGHRLCVKLKEQTIREKYGRCILHFMRSGIVPWWCCMHFICRIPFSVNKRICVWIMRLTIDMHLLCALAFHQSEKTNSLRTGHGHGQV